MPARLPLGASSTRRPGPIAHGTAYTGAWQKARRAHLAHEPLCRACAQAGRTTAANTVDHIIPHRGNMELFWQRSNWQSLCATCSSGDKQRLEKSGVSGYRGCDVDGSPLDPHHRWNG